MPPLSIQSVKNPDWLRGSGFVYPPAPGFLLDNLAVQPLWAHAIGVQLRTGQLNLFRCRRSSDDAEQDFTVADLVDIEAALNTFCGAGIGYLSKAYNAIAASPYPEIGIADPAQQPVVYSADDGGALIGDTGFLAARFLGGYNGAAYPYITTLQRNDALGLTGAAALTLVGDMNLTSAPALTNFDSVLGWIGGSDDNVPYTQLFFVDLGYDDGSDTYTVNGGTLNGAVFSLADALRAPGWWQSDIAAAALIQASRSFVNGVQIAFDHGQGSNLALNLTNDRFAWGPSSTSGNATGLSPQGLASNLFCWNAVLGAPDQALINAWQLAHHA